MSYVIPPGETRTVGRTSAASIVTGDDFMSGKHFEISNIDGKAQLLDLQSRNRTKVNHEVITSVDLRAEDEISAGKSRFRIAWEVCEIPRDADKATSKELPQPAPSLSKLPSNDSPFESSFFDSLPEAMEPTRSPEAPPIRRPEPSPRERKPESLGNADNDFVSPIESVDSVFFNVLKPPDASGDSFLSQAASASSDADLDRVDSIATPQLVNASPWNSIEWQDAEALDRMFLNGDQRRGAFANAIESLAHELDFFVVAHFRKLSMAPPADMPCLSLFPEYDPQGQFLPVAIPMKQWLIAGHSRFAQRLVENDGLLLVLCDTDSSTGEEIQALGRKGFGGFSEPNGFLPWCWPSQLKRMSESLSDQALAQWMGLSVGGLVFPLEAAGRVEAMVRPELGKPLARIGFQ